jgi:hypothetical protein
MPRPVRYKRRRILTAESPKTTTRQGKNDYMRDYMRIRRAEQKQGMDALCKMDLQRTLGMDLRKLGRKKK